MRQWLLVVMIAALPAPLATAATTIVGVLDASGPIEWTVEVPLPPVGDEYVLVEAAAGQRLLDAATGETVVSLQIGDDDSGRAGPAAGGWWHAPPGVPVVVQVLDASGEPAELVAYHLDGHEAWRRALPVPGASPVSGGCCVEVRDGPDAALVVRDGRAGPDALVVTLDAATGATRRVSMRIDPAAPPDPDGSGIPAR